MWGVRLFMHGSWNVATIGSGHGLSPIGASYDSSDNTDLSVWWLQMHQDIGNICLNEIHGLMQERRNSIANTLVLHPFYIKPSKRVITHSAKYSTTNPWWRHQMETFSALLAYCAGNSPVTWSWQPQYRLTVLSAWWLQISWHIFCHDDVIKWKHFPRYWPFVRGIHRSPVNSPHKGQWRGALMFSLICARINDWVNNCEAGHLRRRRAHSDVTVMRKDIWNNCLNEMVIAQMYGDQCCPTMINIPCKAYRWLSVRLQ